MNKMIKVAKYQLFDFVRGTTIFYGIVIASLLLISVLEGIFGDGAGTSNGMEMPTLIFLFVAGLNSFKAAFLFTQANGVTRRDYYLGSALCFGAVAVFFTAADLLVYGIFHGMLDTLSDSLFNMIFPGHAFLTRLPWNMLFNLLMLTVGWFVTALFYRASKGQKVAIALTPVLLMLLLPVAVRLLGGDFLAWLRNMIVLFTGLSGNRPLVGMASMAVLSAVCLALTWLLMRRAEIK